MNFDRYCGMASAAAILVVLTLNAWLGLWGPIWSAAWKVQPSDALGVIVAMVGWIVTISLGALAYIVTQRQIKLGRDQVDLQQRQIAMQQYQIAEAREEQRKSNFARLDREFHTFAKDIDRLKTSQGYLGTFSARFPDAGRLDGWSAALFFVRKDAAEFVSQSAVSAPFGYGERISTVMNRIQRLGDRLVEGSPDSMPTRGVLDYYELRVAVAVEGIRTIESQISAEIPEREAQLIALADERDSYAAAKTQASDFD
jgi:hypothetical protein